MSVVAIVEMVGFYIFYNNKKITCKVLVVVEIKISAVNDQYF